MYRVELAGKLIGETRLEVADPPMGVVGGLIEWRISDNPYQPVSYTHLTLPTTPYV